MARRSRSLFHREQRAIDPTGTFSGWNDSLALTGVVPPHGFDSLNRAGVNVTPKTVLSISTVQRCLEVIQNAMFMMGRPRPYVEKWDKDGIPYKSWMPGNDPNYPALLHAPWGRSVFANAAAVQYSDGIGRTVTSLGLFGEAWWLITKYDEGGNAISLEPLHPAFIEQVVDQNATKLLHVYYGHGANRIELNPADLVHMNRLVLPGDRSGLSPIESEAPIFAIAIAAVQYSQMWFAQGGQASYVLTTDQKLGEKEIDRIFEHLLLEHSGMAKAYTPLILDSNVKPSFTQINPNESQMNETLQYVRQEIAGYFGIPAHLVGTTGDSGNVWGKGIQEQNYSLSDFTLSGYRIPIEEAFTQILPGGMGAGIDSKAILRANGVDTSKENLNNRTSATTTPNEERRKQGLPPSSEPGADSIHTPLTSIPVPPEEPEEGTEAA